ncbi:metaxin-1 isoform X1 [Bacillus rossius redtenbacheri]|uniref:metaxin-1 isoform X1 n=1 Tax=Bacillus rossius redtenbacheri TaxID=93214 RepID=UPI002FDDEE6C
MARGKEIPVTVHGEVFFRKAEAYAVFSGIPFSTQVTNNPFKTPHGELPVCRTGKIVLINISDFKNYFRKLNMYADAMLSEEQCADVSAYNEILKEMLYPALLYVWWLSERNYEGLTRPWYARALPFPLHFYYPQRYHADARAKLEALGAASEDAVYSEAKKCLTMLSHRLGDKQFLFGNHPSSLDATLYAHLAPLLKAPFPEAKLQNHLKGCTNLVKFIERVSQRYFTDAWYGYLSNPSPKQTERDRDTGQCSSESELFSPYKNTVFAGLFATVAMLLYAFGKGIIQVSTEQDDNPASYEDLPEESAEPER